VTEHLNPGRLTRRAVLTGGAAVAGAVALRITTPGGKGGTIEKLDDAKLAVSVKPDVHLAATDGWVSIADPSKMLPSEVAAMKSFWPDSLAYGHGDQATQDANVAFPGSGLNMYVFGFRNVTDLPDADVTLVRGHAQISAPLLAFKEGQGYRVQLTNMGLSQRPDLVDGHTIHWHGFVNELPVFDGVPELSLSVPIGRSLTYFYRPEDPGTYMYHCHFEDVEHVQMGMTGLLFVRPAQDGKSIGGFTKFAYNCLDGSTGYDREYSVFETEIFAEGHYRDAHIQVSDWTDFHASFWALNGRTYPDTLAEPMPWNATRGYDPNDPAAGGRLQYQPQSARIDCNSGERVLLRMASLGYQNHVMTADNLSFRIVGRDASLLRDVKKGVTAPKVASDYVYNYVDTNQIEIGPGESADVLFTAPTFSGGQGTSGAGYDSYLFYDRNYAYASNAGAASTPGGMATEIRVYASGVAVQPTSTTSPKA
jgi:hypothetical protein